jgi:uncharacterized membrane protein
MTTERGLDRLIFFTDAVAAIAITLLILPLVDLVPDAAHDGTTTAEFLADNGDQVLGFVISFAVIARLWRAHHATFEHVRAYSVPLIYLNLIWAFTIVVLPLPTAMISEFAHDRLVTALYIGTMAISSLALTAISMVIRRNPTVEHADNRLGHASLAGSVATTALFFVALVLAVAFPVVGLWALFVLFLAGPAATLIGRPFAHRTAAATNRTG